MWLGKARISYFFLAVVRKGGGGKAEAQWPWLQQSRLIWNWSMHWQCHCLVYRPTLGNSPIQTALVGWVITGESRTCGSLAWNHALFAQIDAQSTKLKDRQMFKNVIHPYLLRLLSRAAFSDGCCQLDSRAAVPVDASRPMKGQNEDKMYLCEKLPRWRAWRGQLESFSQVSIYQIWIIFFLYTGYPT